MAIKRTKNRFGARATFDTGNGTAYYYRLARLEEMGVTKISRLPFTIRVLLESVLREANGFEITDDDVTNLAQWNAKQPAQRVGRMDRLGHQDAIAGTAGRQPRAARDGIWSLEARRLRQKDRPNRPGLDQLAHGFVSGLVNPVLNGE